MIKIDNLIKFFGQFMVVDGLFFWVVFGEVLGFFGFNGVGKFIIMKMIIGFMVSSFGKVMVFENDVSVNLFKIKVIIGYLLEGVFSYGDMIIV